jgi:ORF6N domain
LKDVDRMPASPALAVPGERIERSILFVRGQKVMLDRDLAQLYGVETRVLNQAVRRNIRRFPSDFMFQMNPEEFSKWKSQIVMSNKERMGLRRRPLVFTEQGVAMLSSVLGSDRAIDVNIAIMRAFVRLREMMTTHKELAQKIGELEKKYDAQFRAVFDAIRELLQPAAIPSKRRIGF